MIVVMVKQYSGTQAICSLYLKDFAKCTCLLWEYVLLEDTGPLGVVFQLLIFNKIPYLKEMTLLYSYIKERVKKPILLAKFSARG